MNGQRSRAGSSRRSTASALSAAMLVWVGSCGGRVVISPCDDDTTECDGGCVVSSNARSTTARALGPCRCCIAHAAKSESSGGRSSSSSSLSAAPRQSTTGFRCSTVPSRVRRCATRSSHRATTPRAVMTITSPSAPV
jgi:hypothetical protein